MSEETTEQAPAPKRRGRPQSKNRRNCSSKSSQVQKKSRHLSVADVPPKQKRKRVQKLNRSKESSSPTGSSNE